MKIPVITGIIDRRILINYRVDEEIIQKILPSPFRPKLYEGKAIAGICLIRLKHIRPKGLPAFIGISSENAAHRIAVQWNENGVLKEGVFIPRRDTSSVINSLAGGRIFPGKHFKAKFLVNESAGKYALSFRSLDGNKLELEAITTDQFDSDSIFKNIENVSHFFENGCDGYSPNNNGFDGLQLKTFTWEIKPMQMLKLSSDFFNDKNKFPVGTIQLDNVLLMTNIHHEWHSLPSLHR